LSVRSERPPVTPSVETTDPDGVDFGWVMQVTFVVTITLGSVVVAALSLGVSLPTWGERALFAVRVGAVIWLLTAVGAYVYARRYRTGGTTVDSDGEREGEGGANGDGEDPLEA